MTKITILFYIADIAHILTFLTCLTFLIVSIAQV